MGIKYSQVWGKLSSRPDGKECLPTKKQKKKKNKR
jgi:hypothetical protein